MNTLEKQVNTWVKLASSWDWQDHLERLESSQEKQENNQMEDYKREKTVLDSMQDCSQD